MKHIEIIMALVVAVVLSIIITLGTGHYMSLRAKAAHAEEADKILAGTAGMQKDGAAVQEVIHRFEVDLSAGSQAFEQRQKEGERNNETVASRADVAVPDSVRDNFRQRRLARDRSQRAALERLGTPQTQDAGQR